MAENQEATLVQALGEQRKSYLEGRMQDDGIKNVDAFDPAYIQSKVSGYDRDFGLLAIQNLPANTGVPDWSVHLALKDLGVPSAGPTPPRGFDMMRALKEERAAQEAQFNELNQSAGLLSEAFGEPQLVPTFDSQLVWNGFQAWVSSGLQLLFSKTARDIRREDPDTFDRIYRQLPSQMLETDNMIGVKQLKDTGMWPWLAEAVPYVALDPMWALDGTMFRTAKLLGEVAVKVPQFVAKDIWAGFKAASGTGKRLTIEEADYLVRLRMDPMQQNLASVRPITPAGELAQAAEVFKVQGREVESTFLSRLGRGKNKTPASVRRVQRSKAGQLYTQMVRDEVDPSVRATMALEWLDATAASDLPVVQSFLANADVALEPSLLRRAGNSVEVFYDPVTKKQIRLREGFESEFAKTPDWFIGNSGKLRREYKALADALGLDEAGLARLAKVRPMGREGTETQLYNLAREVARDTGVESFVPGLESGTSWWRKGIQNVRPRRAATGSDGVVDIVHTTTNRARTSTAARMLQVHNALGGSLIDTSERMAGAMMSGSPLGLRVISASPLMRKSTSIVGKAIGRLRDLFSPSAKAARRELNDQIYVHMVSGNKKALDAINEIRTADGLQLLTPKMVSKQAAGYGENLRSLLNSWRHEAVRSGVIGPDEFITDYLPKLYSSLRKGLTFDQAVEVVGKRFGNRANGIMEKDPFFRHRRVDQFTADRLITDVPELLRRYATALDRHLTLKPMADDVLTSVADARNTLTAGERQARIDVLFDGLGKAVRPSIEEAAKYVRGGKALEALMLLDNVGGRQAMGRYINRQLSSVLMLKFFGGLKGIGKGIRNTTQGTIVTTQIGSGNAVDGFALQARGMLKYLNQDAELLGMIRESNTKWNWLGSYDELAAEAAQVNLRSFGLGDARLGDVIPQQVMDAMMFAYKNSDSWNRFGASYGGGVEALVDALAAGDGAVQKLLASYTQSERNVVNLLLKQGNTREAMKAIGEFTVNDTQWVYSKTNRPGWLKAKLAGVPIEDHPVVGMALLFMSWSANYTEAMLRQTMAGVRGRGALGGMTKAINNFGQHQAVQLALAAQLDAVGRGVGLGSLGDWMLAKNRDLKMAGFIGPNKDWVEEHGNSSIPVPWMKSLTTLANPSMIAGNIYQTQRMYDELYNGIIEDEEGRAAWAVDRLVKMSGLGAGSLEPWIRERAIYDFGLEPDYWARSGFRETFFSPFIFQTSPELTEDQRLKAAFGFPQSAGQ